MRRGLRFQIRSSAEWCAVSQVIHILSDEGAGMIQITQLKLPVTHTEEQLKEKAAKLLRIPAASIHSLEIVRRSIDARDKSDIRFVYTIRLCTNREEAVCKKSRHNNVTLTSTTEYVFPEAGEHKPEKRPVIIGSGPAGLFCAWILAQKGYAPILLERGGQVEDRQKSVALFWKAGVLDPESNVQFGEGGAGTFSDGKLNTQVKDKTGRNTEVLRIFVQAGAPENILYDARPHLGTDVLTGIVAKMREQIRACGGDVYFRTKVVDLNVRDGAVAGVRTDDGRVFETDKVVLAIGHSARDTFEMLAQKSVLMEQKSFAVGVRVQHPQKLIDLDQYGPDAPKILGPAYYRLAEKFPDGRGVYSFCMCPGGYVVNASSEEGMLAVNGMSYSGRSSKNANSAIVVSVTPEDFLPFAREDAPSVLNGMYFQRELEKRAFEKGEGKIPVQRFADFREKLIGNAGNLEPVFKGEFTMGDVRGIFPEVLQDHLEKGILAFDRKIPGFADGDTLLAGVESRTSSPVRILRDENLESSIKGLYPCGEGAGYAGGITSAAMDGLRVADAIAWKCKS